MDLDIITCNGDNALVKITEIRPSCIYNFEYLFNANVILSETTKKALVKHIKYKTQTECEHNRENILEYERTVIQKLQSYSFINDENSMYIAKIYGYGCYEESDLIVFEYVGQTLMELISEASIISYEDNLDIAVKIAKGLKLLHDNDIVHGEITNETIYIDYNSKDKKYNPKIFGIGQPNLLQNSRRDGRVSKVIKWIARERFTKNKIIKEGDIYSFGLVLNYLFSSKEHFNDKGIYEYAIYVIHDKEIVIENTISKRIKNIINKCLHHEANKRPTIDQLLSELLLICK